MRPPLSVHPTLPPLRWPLTISRCPVSAKRPQTTPSPRSPTKCSLCIGQVWRVSTNGVPMSGPFRTPGLDQRNNSTVEGLWSRAGYKRFFPHTPSPEPRPSTESNNRVVLLVQIRCPQRSKQCLAGAIARLSSSRPEP